MTEAQAFKLLGLKAGAASPDAVRKAYHDLAWKNHPDLGGRREDFARLADANRIAIAVTYAWPCETCRGTGEVVMKSKASFGGAAGKILCGHCGGTGKKW